MANGNFGGGDGSELYPFLIEDAEDLLSVREKNAEYPFYHYKQVADIDCSGIDNWIPIGDTIPFMGVYDGMGFYIRNLTVTSNVDGGLFRDLVNATLKNINIENMVVNCKMENSVDGALLFNRALDNSLIENCYVQGKVTGYAYNQLCGFAGHFYEGTIVKNCKSDVIIENYDSYSYSSGFVYNIGPDVIVENCSSKTKIYAPERGSYGIGFSMYIDGEVSKCSAHVDIEAGRGGFGFSFTIQGGTVKNCYAEGKITAIYKEEEYCFMSGFAWYGYSGALIENCYTAVKIPEPTIEKYPGIIFYMDEVSAFIISNSAEIKDCYADITLCPIQSHPTEGVNERTTDEMQRKLNYFNWDFNKVWFLKEGRDYPRLEQTAYQMQAIRLN